MERMHRPGCILSVCFLKIHVTSESGRAPWSTHPRRARPRWLAVRRDGGKWNREFIALAIARLEERTAAEQGLSSHERNSPPDCCSQGFAVADSLTLGVRFESLEADKTKHTPLGVCFVLAAEQGLEPQQTDSETVVLPLHHSAIFSISDYSTLFSFVK